MFESTTHAIFVESLHKKLVDNQLYFLFLYQLSDDRATLTKIWEWWSRFLVLQFVWFFSCIRDISDYKKDSANKKKIK